MHVLSKKMWLRDYDMILCIICQMCSKLVLVRVYVRSMGNILSICQTRYGKVMLLHYSWD